MSRKDDFFNYTISELEKKGQYELALHFHHQRMREMVNQKKEREQLKREIVEEVLSRISIMFETGEAIKEINSLNKAIEQLEK